MIRMLGGNSSRAGDARGNLSKGNGFIFHRGSRTVERQRPKLTKKGKPEGFSGKVRFLKGKPEGKAWANLGANLGPTWGLKFTQKNRDRIPHDRVPRKNQKILAFLTITGEGRRENEEMGRRPGCNHGGPCKDSTSQTR